MKQKPRTTLTCNIKSETIWEAFLYTFFSSHHKRKKIVRFVIGFWNLIQLMLAIKHIYWNSLLSRKPTNNNSKTDFFVLLLTLAPSLPSHAQYPWNFISIANEQSWKYHRDAIWCMQRTAHIHHTDRREKKKWTIFTCILITWNIPLGDLRLQIYIFHHAMRSYQLGIGVRSDWKA